MDYIKIDKIKEILIENGFNREVDEINERIASGSTGGEIRGAVLHFLFHLETENPNANAVIIEQINELRQYADSIGLQIR